MRTQPFEITPLDFDAAWSMGSQLLDQPAQAVRVTESELTQAYPGRRVHIHKAFASLAQGPRDGAAALLGYSMSLPQSKGKAVTYGIVIQGTELFIHCGQLPHERFFLAPPHKGLPHERFLELCLESLLRSAPKRLGAVRDRPRAQGWLRRMAQRMFHSS